MPASMTHSMLTEHPKWFENQTSNRPPDGVNSNSNYRALTEIRSTHHDAQLW